MPQLRIERVPITGLAVGGFDHMHLVLEPDQVVNSTYPQDEWLAIEGTFSGPATARVLRTLGGSGLATLPDLNGGLTGFELQQAIGTPGARGSRVLPVFGDPEVQWLYMAALARDIDSQNLPYNSQLIGSRISFNINSSSVIATLLHSIGLEIAQNLPFGVGRTNGWQTLIGTSGDDVLRIDSTFVNIIGGPGNDTFFGGNQVEQFERFHGGLGDDEFTWSKGSNTYHGGQLGLDYASDGLDTVSYANVDTVRLEINPARLPHLAADIFAFHASGQDNFLSIEAIKWATNSDTISLGEGLSLLNKSINLDLGDQSSAGQGDTVDFSEADKPIQLVAATNTDLNFAQAAGTADSDVGVWLDSAEWIIGSGKDDQAYLGWGVRGFDGGAGDDLIDVRAIDTFEARSPDGYDIEIYGGSGNDTIVAGHGRTFASGGSGNDIFVVSELSDSGSPLNEFVISDASTSDRLYASYNFFNESFAPFEGSELLPLLGAISQFSGEASFSDLPQNEGPFSQGDMREDFFPFHWQTDNDRFYQDDETVGVIDFAGNIYYNRDGSDLLIHIFGGFGADIDEVGSNGMSYTSTANFSVLSTEVIVRVVDFKEGDLGINFYDIGDPEPYSFSRSHGDYTGSIFPNWDEHINILTNNGVLTAPLPPAPDAPTYDPDDAAPPAPPNFVIGSAQNDVIATLSGNQDVDALAGDDTVTTQDGDDVIDGGPGTDTMEGGDGDDTYVVDNVNDRVIEMPGGGNDTVVSSTSFTLPDHVENLTLVSSTQTLSSLQTTLLATTLDGTGNSLRNTLTGNEDSNTLTGLGGDDVLYGALSNDVLIGGEGSDHYVYFFGDGDDQIFDDGSASDLDQLHLDGFEIDDLSFYQLETAPEDLIIAFNQGGRIEVIDYFDASGNNTGVDLVVLTGLNEWARTDIDSMVAVAGPVLNEAPQAADDNSFALRGPTAVLSAGVLLANDRDYDGDPLAIIAVTSDNPDVTATVNANGDIALTSPIGFDGFATLTYTISDGQGGEASAETGVSLYPNQAPLVGSVDAQSSPEDSSWTFTLPAELYNDPDGDAVTLSAQLASGAALPSWMTFDSATETFSATPPENFNATLSLQITASDGEAATSSDFDLTITPVNDTPDAQDDTGFETNQDEALTIPAADLLANDSDVDGDTLTIESVHTSQNGTVTLNTSGDVVFTPTAGFSGAAAFDYTVSDGAGGSSIATVDLTVSPDPGPPTIATIIGTPGNDRLVGTDGADIFDGLAGHDRMIGRGGDDIFLGGVGADVLRGGCGTDTADYSLSPEAISVIFFGVGYGSGGDAQGDLLISVENILGSAHDDTISTYWNTISADGQGGNDVLRGGHGSDRLAGGQGTDELTGGYGDDTFVFGDGDGADTIRDFSSGHLGWWWWWRQSQGDTIELDVTGVDTFQDVLAHASESNGDVVFDFGNNDILTLRNTRLTQLDDGDFLFV